MATQTVKILTYNAHLFQGSNADLARDVINTLAPFDREQLQKDIVVYEDDLRLDKILDHVRNSGADIVGLQEVWSTVYRQKVTNDLKNIYPYAFFPSESPGTFDETLDYFSPKKWVQAAKDEARISSGTILLSKE